MRRSARTWVVVTVALSTSCFGGRVAPGGGDGAEPRDAAPDVPDAPRDPGVDTGPADAGPTVRELCFSGIGDSTQDVLDYDQFHPTVGSHCKGTNHQTIEGVEKLVFLGDSVTEGTPPTPSSQYYRSIVERAMRERFGDIDVSECADWGARTDDLMLPPHQQIQSCFPDVETRRSLVVMTVGGNDMANMAKDNASEEAALAQAQETVELFGAAIRYLKDPAHFPNGSYVVFANIFEFTDGTGDLSSCPQTILAGYPPRWDNGRAAYLFIDEQYMRIAVETHSDMIFLLESFCGHGFNAGDPENECYRGPNTQTWFDFTCIHPNPTGHAALADLFISTINE